MTDKKKPRNGGNRPGAHEDQMQHQSIAHSPRSEAQRQRILQALRARPQTTEDLRKLGIFAAAARIKELRDRFGYEISTDLIRVTDREGFPHPGVALYSLVGGPKVVR